MQPLIELQRLDGQIRDLERQAKDIPALKAQENARLAGVNAALEIAASKLKAQKDLIASCENEEAELKAQAQQARIAQATPESNKEYTQLVMRTENLERDAEAAARRATSLMEDLPHLEKEMADAQARVAKAKGGVDSNMGDLDERLERVKAELATLKAERAVKAAAVAPNELLTYERLLTKRWPVVVALNSDDVCDGCHMKQPPFVAQLVQHNKGMVTCTMCGRILYRD